MNIACLTEKERDIASRLYELDNTKAIARALHISESTVKTRLTRAFAKLGALSRVQVAVLWDRYLREQEAAQ